jgi:hypothetical protein
MREDVATGGAVKYAYIPKSHSIRKMSYRLETVDGWMGVEGGGIPQTVPVI